MFTDSASGSQKTPYLSSEVGIDKKVESSIESLCGKIESIAPKLIFLSGTSTSGKSTIMREYAKSRDNTVELGTDDFEETRVASLIKTHYPEEYNILSQAVDDKSINRFLFYTPRDLVESKPELFFKPESSVSEREAAIALNYDSDFQPKCSDLLKTLKKDQDKEHVETILDHLDRGVSVIFDTPNEDNFYKQFEQFSKAPHRVNVERFLVYVPLGDLINRLGVRNADSISTGNLSNQRQNIDLLNQFKSTYRKARPGEAVVDILKKEDIEKIFEANRKDIDNENKNMQEQGNTAHVVEQEAYLEYFGLTPLSPEVGITTITDYKKFDGIFRTANQSTESSIKQLSTHTWERFK